MRCDRKDRKILHADIAIEEHKESLYMMPEDMMAAGDRNGRMKVGLNKEAHMNLGPDEVVDMNIDLLLQANQYYS
jgi:hypothetical protein